MTEVPAIRHGVSGVTSVPTSTLKSILTCVAEEDRTCSTRPHCNHKATQFSATHHMLKSLRSIRFADDTGQPLTSVHMVPRIDSCRVGDMVECQEINEPLGEPPISFIDSGDNTDDSSENEDSSVTDDSIELSGCTDEEELVEL